MYKTTLTKEELAYNLAYQITTHPETPIKETVFSFLQSVEKNQKNNKETLDNK